MRTVFVGAIVGLFVIAGACGSGRGWFLEQHRIDKVIRLLRRRTDPLLRRAIPTLDE
jgi:hypothetical protein